MERDWDIIRNEKMPVNILMLNNNVVPPVVAVTLCEVKMSTL